MNKQSTLNGTAVKMVSENGDTFTVAGYGVAWGGADLVGETFTKDTDFWFDRLTETPMVLYSHGQDKTMGTTVIGRVTTKTVDDYGLWIEAQIHANEAWSDAVRQLIGADVLGWSSGAVPHLVDKKRSGKKTLITSWPIAEWTLTPGPCEPRILGIQEVRSLADFDPAIKSMLTDDDADPLGLKALTSDPITRPWHQSLKAMSYEDRRRAIEALLNPAQAFVTQPQPYVCICETFDDHVIVSRWDGDDQDYYSIDYTVDPDTEMISLGAPVEVEQTYVPVAVRSVSERPLRASAIDATLLIHAVADQAKATVERRTKEGRVLSTQNRSRLEDLMSAMDGAMGSIRDLLEASMPAEPAKAVETDQRLRFLAHTTRLKGLQLVA